MPLNLKPRLGQSGTDQECFDSHHGRAVQGARGRDAAEEGEVLTQRDNRRKI